MKERFTKGEWLAKDGDGFSKEVIITTDDREDCFIIPICEMDMFFDGDIGVEQAANANLIAAAPEMYAMLKQVSELVDMDGGSAIDWIIENTFDIRELLAKARGEK